MMVVGCFALHRMSFLLKYVVNLQSMILLSEGAITVALESAQGRPESFKKWKFLEFCLKYTREVFFPLLGLFPRSQGNHCGICVDPYLKGWDIFLLATDASLTCVE